MQKKTHAFLSALFVRKAVHSATDAALEVFEIAGHRVLDETGREMLIKFVEPVAHVGTKVLGEFSKGAVKELGSEGAKSVGKGIASQGAKTVTKNLSTEGAKALTSEALKAGGKQIFGAVVRGSAFGGVIDGGFAAVGAGRRWFKGEMTGGEAFTHVAKEASTGMASSGAGVLVGAAAVALTGGALLPVVGAIGIGVSVITKVGLTKLVS